MHVTKHVKILQGFGADGDLDLDVTVCIEAPAAKMEQQTLFICITA